MDRAKSVTPLMGHPVIKAMADKYRKSTAQILLRWSTQRGMAVIPRASEPEFMAQNLACTSFDLDQVDMDRIAKMDLGLKFNQPTNVRGSPVCLPQDPKR